MIVNSQPSRCGLTLIELLVVLAIISLLMGLTLAGVQRVRATAARARCQDNLRQVGLALQNYHSAHHRLPIGVTGQANLNEPYPFMTWLLRLMPYLEQESIWFESVRAFRIQPSFQVDPPHIHRPRPMSAFSCPSDPRTSSPAPFPLLSGGTKEYGLTSYLGVQGVNATRADGLLVFDIAYRLTDATDGTSNTLLVGERPPSANLRFGWWYAGEGMEKDGSADSILGVRAFCRKPTDCQSCSDAPGHFTLGQFQVGCDFVHFWSPHSGGANFAFADGSVRFLAYSADSILPALATRAGGEVVALPD